MREWGPGDGRPILFLHSLGPASSAALVGLAAEPLVRCGFRLVAPDLPGCGASPALAESSGYAVPRLAALAWALADRLELSRPVVAGHSWGGAIACEVAASRPERTAALVLVDSGHLDYAELAGARLDATLDELVAEAEGARLCVPDRAALAGELDVDQGDPLADALLEGMRADGAGGLVSVTTGAARGAAMYHLMRAATSETWPTLERAGIPTLLLLATEPPDLRRTNERALERFAPAFPSAEIVPVEGATHSLVTDLRERFGELVADWLARHP